MKTYLKALLVCLALLQLAAGQGMVVASSDTAYVKAVKAHKNKEYEKALTLFLDVAARFPSSPDLVEKIGTCYLDLERYGEAVQHYKKNLGIYPDSWMLKNNLAVAYRLSERHEEAIEIYKDILQTRPEDDQLWYALGFSYLRIKKNAEAEDAFLRSTAIDPNWSEAWYRLGMVCERQQKYSDSLMHYSRALNLDTKNEEAWGRFRTLLLDYGPHAPYVEAWIDAPQNADLAAYQARAEEKVKEVAYSVFPKLRDPDHPMWTAFRTSYATVQEKNPDFTKSPTIF